MRDDVELHRLSDIPDPYRAEATKAPGVARRPDAPAPTRAEVRRRKVVALAAALAYEAFWLAVLSAHRGDRSRGALVLGFLVPLVAGAAALAVVLRRGSLGLGASAGRTLAGTLGAVAFFAAATFLFAPADPRGGAFWHEAIGCMRTTAIFAAGPLALGLWALRRGIAAASALRSAALGVACGALAAVMMSVVCPHGGVMHVMMGHGAVVLVTGVGAALLGRRLARS